MITVDTAHLQCKQQSHNKKNKQKNNKQLQLLISFHLKPFVDDEIIYCLGLISQLKTKANNNNNQGPVAESEESCSAVFFMLVEGYFIHQMTSHQANSDRFGSLKLAKVVKKWLRVKHRVICMRQGGHVQMKHYSNCIGGKHFYTALQKNPSILVHSAYLWSSKVKFLLSGSLAVSGQTYIQS